MKTFYKAALVVGPNNETAANSDQVNELKFVKVEVTDFDFESEGSAQRLDTVLKKVAISMHTLVKKCKIVLIHEHDTDGCDPEEVVQALVYRGFINIFNHVGESLYVNVTEEVLNKFRGGS